MTIIDAKQHYFKQKYQVRKAELKQVAWRASYIREGLEQETDAQNNNEQNGAWEGGEHETLGPGALKDDAPGEANARREPLFWDKPEKLVAGTKMACDIWRGGYEPWRKSLVHCQVRRQTALD